MQHPKTQRAAPVHYAAVQRHVKTLSPWQPQRETAEFCLGNGKIIDATPFYWDLWVLSSVWRFDDSAVGVNGCHEI